MTENTQPVHNPKELSMRILSLENKLHQFIEAQLHANVLIHEQLEALKKNHDELFAWVSKINDLLHDTDE